MLIEIYKRRRNSTWKSKLSSALFTIAYENNCSAKKIKQGHVGHNGHIGHIVSWLISWGKKVAMVFAQFDLYDLYDLFDLYSFIRSFYKLSHIPLPLLRGKLSCQFPERRPSCHRWQDSTAGENVYQMAR